MLLKLLSFNTVNQLIQEERGTPDLFSAKGTGPRSVKLTRDNAYGLEAALQQVCSGFGMTSADFSRLNSRLGWLIVTQP